MLYIDLIDKMQAILDAFIKDDRRIALDILRDGEEPNFPLDGTDYEVTSMQFLGETWEIRFQSKNHCSRYYYRSDMDAPIRLGDIGEKFDTAL